MPQYQNKFIFLDNPVCVLSRAKPSRFIICLGKTMGFLPEQGGFLVRNCSHGRGTIWVHLG